MTLTEPVWVFGYGSLIFKQDFPYLDSRRGRITGWARRFWQGSHDHRGVPEAPGRVVTLIEDAGGVCDGVAFLVEPDVFEHLDHREKNGYERIPVDIAFDHGMVAGVVYRAAEHNEAWLGPAPLDEIAAHIDRSSGPSGNNREYLLELAQALRGLGVTEDHVLELEERLLSRMRPTAD